VVPKTRIKKIGRLEKGALFRAKCQYLAPALF